MSPLLWCLVVDELLSRLREAGLLVCGYADDIVIMVRGRYLDALWDQVTRELSAMQNWCAEVGLSVNPAKTTAMVFTR